MDPISALILMAAQLGVKNALGAIVGDDLGGLASAFLGLVAQAEQTQDRLITIERKLDALRDQRFETELRDGTRLVERALNRGASPEREAELAQGQRLLERAVASTDNPMARTLAEQMAIVVQLLRGDVIAVQQSCRMLDAAAGDALDDAQQRRNAPVTEMERRVAGGEYGTATWLERFRASAGTPDHRYDEAREDVWDEVKTETTELLGLLNFAARVSELVGLPTGLIPTEDGVYVRLSGDAGVVADASLGRPARLGGTTITLSRPARAPRRAGPSFWEHEVTYAAAVDSSRQRAVEVKVTGYYNPATSLRAGQTATITEDAQTYGTDHLERFSVTAGAVEVSAAVTLSGAGFGIRM